MLVLLLVLVVLLLLMVVLMLLLSPVFVSLAGCGNNSVAMPLSALCHHMDPQQLLPPTLPTSAHIIQLPFTPSHSLPLPPSSQC